jgi:hypothetical protein
MKDNLKFDRIEFEPPDKDNDICISFEMHSGLDYTFVNADKLKEWLD